jgi:hypothetical protein
VITPAHRFFFPSWHKIRHGRLRDKKLAATAKSAEDHLTLARFYRVEANGLDAQAATYEEAAANLRNGPTVEELHVADHGKSL